MEQAPESKNRLRTAAEEQVRAAIAAKGQISFAEFMELALYAPEGGFYHRAAEQFGTPELFYTSPIVHPAFGALLARQLAAMWEYLGSPKVFWAIEAGASHGLLAYDIISYATEALPGFAAALRYLAVDRAKVSLRHELGQGHRIRAWGVPARGVTGCVLANELWDNFPVHRLRLEAGRLQEVYLTLQEDEVVEVLGRPTEAALVVTSEQQGWPEGVEREVRPNLAPWLQEAARALEKGFLLSIDYGYLRSEQAGSTLLSYSGQRFSESLYEGIGERDITAHVDFSAAIAAAQKTGFGLVELTTQEMLLKRLGLGSWIEASGRLGLPQEVLYANQFAIRELIRPDGLGSFGVLLLSKGVDSPPQARELTPGTPPAPPLPLLDERRLRIAQARYPHLGIEVGDVFSASWGEGCELGP